MTTMTRSQLNSQLNTMFDRYTAQNPTLTPTQWEQGFMALAMAQGFTENQVGYFLGIGQ